ncbi:ABC transporter permease subunit, partial [bacterium]
FGLGATRWQTIRNQVLPNALPGIMTGIILAVSRALGETAPLVVVGAVSYIAAVPRGLNDEFTVLPLQIFDWTSRPQKGFHDAAAAAIIVLLGILLILNAAAIVLRARASRA